MSAQIWNILMAGVTPYAQPALVAVTALAGPFSAVVWWMAKARRLDAAGAVDQARAEVLVAQSGRADRALHALLRAVELDPDRWTELGPSLMSLTGDAHVSVNYDMSGSPPANAPPMPAGVSTAGVRALGVPHGPTPGQAPGS